MECSRSFDPGRWGTAKLSVLEEEEDTRRPSPRSEGMGGVWRLRLGVTRKRDKGRWLSDVRPIKLLDDNDDDADDDDDTGSSDPRFLQDQKLIRTL